jgi:hypothetical protein
MGAGATQSQENLSMRTWMLLAVGLGLVAASGSGHAQQREAGAHEHGRGTLNIALEGSRLSMELEAPGADIVGFEHEARTQKQKAAVESAKKRLAAPKGLFELPAAAGCVLKEAKVALEAEDHDHGHDANGHDTEAHGGKDHDAKGHDHEAAHADNEHSAFHAEYAFDCKAPASLTTIGFGYFKAFAGADKLDVTVIGPKQQSRFEVSRAKPRLDLAGMM